jgi:hypothetical protein
MMGFMILGDITAICEVCGKPYMSHGEELREHLMGPTITWAGGYASTETSEPRPTPEDCHTTLKNVLAELRYASPGDGSDTDKRWDVVITKLEEAEAYFRTYILCK